MNEKTYIKTIKECIKHLPNLIFREDAGCISLFISQKPLLVLYNTDIDIMSWFLYFLKKHRIDENIIRDFESFFYMCISVITYSDVFDEEHWNKYNLPENIKLDIFNTLKDNIEEIKRDVAVDSEGVSYNSIKFKLCKEIDLSE